MVCIFRDIINSVIFLKVYLWLIKTFINIVKNSVFAFLIVEVTAMVMFMLVETPVLEIIARLFSITPKMGVSIGDTVHYNKNDIVWFFVFWGIVLTPVKWLLEKLLKIKFALDFKMSIITLTLFHLFSVVIVSTRWGLGLAPYIAFFYILGLCALAIFSWLDRGSKNLQNFFNSQKFYRTRFY